ALLGLVGDHVHDDGEGLVVPDLDIHVLQRHDADSSARATRVRIDQDVDCRPISQYQLVPNPIDDRAEAGPAALGQVVRELVGGKEGLAVNLVVLQEEDRVGRTNLRRGGEGALDVGVAEVGGRAEVGRVAARDDGVELNQGCECRGGAV